jgi:hypothetical protein
MTFHATFDQADTAFSVHKLQGKTVMMDLYVMEEE